MAQQMTIPAEINHTGMSAQWFDAAVQRSFARDVQVTDLGNGTYAMTSGSINGLTYLVTATSCGCQGHAHAGRCYHRARALWEMWANGTTEPEPPAPVTVPDAIGYTIVANPDGTVGVRQIGQFGSELREIGFTIYPDKAAARDAIGRLRGQQRRPAVVA